MNITKYPFMLTLMASLLLISSTITINQLTTPAFATPTATEEAWSVYSGNGVTFEYPSTWNVEQTEDYGINIEVTNPARENGFVINLPGQYMQQGVSQYSSLQDYANDIFSKMIGYTIIEEFTEKIFNGYPAVAGKVSTIEGIMYVALIDNQGQIYSFSYLDGTNEFDSVDSQRTMLRVIGTFGFL